MSGDERQPDSKGPLADEYEKRVVDADDLSDRLRREADRVLEFASLQARQASFQRQSGELAAQLEECASDKRRIDADWRSLWAACQVQPRTPREMRVWQEGLEKLRDQLGQMNRLRQQADELVQTRNAHIEQLNQQLEALGITASRSESLELALLEC